MRKELNCLLAGLAVVLGLHLWAGNGKAQNASKDPHAPRYAADGRLEFPAGYREWIYLSSGIDMSYNPRIMAMNHSMFDNVFVNPEAYQAFLENGTWPDKTLLVLEVRGAESKGSINQLGKFQNTERMGVEVHVKDEARFPGKWAFFGYDDEQPAKMIPAAASCYSCHQQHAAVDTTFVQFYPTLLPVAAEKKTLNPAYLKELAGADPKRGK